MIKVEKRAYTGNTLTAKRRGNFGEQFWKIRKNGTKIRQKGLK
jgi:hypothetical protein